MGCDIHMHVEVRVDGKWEHYACPSVDRWYALFGVMAGVRGEGPAIVNPKGIPEDVSVITRLDFEMMGEDAHTPSWFNEDEIDKLSDWLSSQREAEKKNGGATSFSRFDLEHGVLNGTYLFGSGLTSFKHYDDMEYLPKSCDAVRMVFWFDN